MKLESKCGQMYTGYFVVLIKENSLSCSTPIIRKRKKLIEKKSKKHKNLKMSTSKTKSKKQRILESTNVDELFDVQFGKTGTKKRDAFEEKAQYFVISEMLKEARKEANLTQEQLANKVGTKKSYISRLENGKCDIQLSTLYRIFETGLGKRINLLIG